MEILTIPRESSVVQDNVSSIQEILVSVVVLNYNGARWIEKCIASVLAQTLPAVELIVADNCSPDGSDRMAAEMLANHPNTLFIQHGKNLGFCEGNNRAVLASRGKYVFLLNNDAWIEPGCVETLVRQLEANGASAGMPLVMNWDDNEPQWGAFASSFDVFGLPVFHLKHLQLKEILMPGGCAYFIRRDLWDMFGGLDPVIFMYADELDLSWKVWISGHRALLVPAARAHHRGAVNVNPLGGEKAVELRTSQTKRYYSNRNCLLVLAKNCQNLLLALIPLQILLLAFESLFALALTRNWNFIKKSYFKAVSDFFGLMPHIRKERARARAFRKRGDFYMLRFLCFRLNRWDEFAQMLKKGVPKVDAR